MSTTHHPLHLSPPRCFRHRVWMAICDDCRNAHRALAGAGPSRRRIAESTDAGE